jgi:hypothetical protein
VQSSTTNPLIAGSGFQGGTTATVDGISINDLFNARVPALIMSFDGIAEFTVIGLDAPAKYGRSGAQILIVTKGGTNQFHGTAFEFNRNKDLSAAGYFPLTPRPNFNRNEFGGSIGGPIVRDKLFFFFTTEDLRLVQSTAAITEQPSPEMLTGDLSVVNQQGNLGITRIWDSATQSYITTPGSAGVCCQLPASSISTTSQYFNGFFPKPNGGVLGTNPGVGCFYPINAGTCAAGQLGSTSISDFIYADPTYEKNFRWSLRGDYQLSSRDHLMLRYYEANFGPYFAPSLSNAAPLFGNFSGDGGEVRNYVANYTRTLTPNVVNEFAVGYDKQVGFRTGQNPNVNPGSLVPGVPNAPPGFGGLPDIGIYGLSGIADYNSAFNITQHDYQFNDNLNFVHGRHSMAAGGQYMRQRAGQNTTYDGAFDFNGCFAAHTCTNGSAGAAENTNVVDAFADYLMGNIFSSETQNRDFGFDATASQFGVYMQDNWLATPKLTLNLGLRYEKGFPFGRTVGGLQNFYPNLNGGAGAVVYISGAVDPNLLAQFPAPAILMGSNVGINYNNYIHTQNFNLGPHVGFALRLNDKGTLVARGGYALIYDFLGPLINPLGASPPFVKQTTYQQPSGSGGSLVPQLTWTNAFSGSTSTGGPSQYGVAQNLKQPYHQQMNLTVEWEFLRNTGLRVTYVCNPGTHLTTPVPLNDPVPQPLAAGVAVQTIRPYQPWGPITFYETATSTNFNQLQAAVRRRFSDLTLSLDFQWTKALGLDAYNDGGVTNPLNFRQDYGNLDTYARRYAVFHHIYTLPVGTGKRLLSHAGKKLNDVVGGWRVSGVLTLRDGFPMSVSFVPVGTLGNYPTGRPNVIPGVPQINKGVVPGKAPMINAAAFCVPGAAGCPVNTAIESPYGPAYTYGDEQRNSLTGPGYANYDASIQKDTRIDSRVTLQLRADAFNALNRTNFAVPSNREINGGSTPFGESTAIQGNARELQLGAKIIF